MKKLLFIIITIVLTITLASCNKLHIHSYEQGVCDCGLISDRWARQVFDLSEEQIKEIIDEFYDKKGEMQWKKDTKYLRLYW